MSQCGRTSTAARWTLPRPTGRVSCRLPGQDNHCSVPAKRASIHVDREGGMMSREAGPRGPVKSPLDFAGGLFLLVLAVLGFAGGFNLATGPLSGIGSGLLPKTLAILIAAFGVLLIVQGLLSEGDSLERWHLRGPAYVLGSVVVFALLIRGSTLNFGGILGIPLLATVKIPSL